MTPPTSTSPSTTFTYRRAIDEWCFLMVPLLSLKELIDAAHARGLLFFTIPRRGTWETLDREELVPPVAYLPGEGFTLGLELELLEDSTLKLREEVGYQPWGAWRPSPSTASGSC